MAQAFGETLFVLQRDLRRYRVLKKLRYAVASAFCISSALGLVLQNFTLLAVLPVLLLLDAKLSSELQRLRRRLEKVGFSAEVDLMQMFEQKLIEAIERCAEKYRYVQTVFPWSRRVLVLVCAKKEAGRAMYNAVKEALYRACCIAYYPLCAEDADAKCRLQAEELMEELGRRCRSADTLVQILDELERLSAERYGVRIDTERIRKIASDA